MRTAYCRFLVLLEIIVDESEDERALLGTRMLVESWRSRLRGRLSYLSDGRLSEQHKLHGRRKLGIGCVGHDAAVWILAFDCRPGG